MAITPVLAIGAGGGRNANLVLGVGVIANVVVFAASGQPPNDAVVDITILSSGAPTLFQRLADGTCTTQLVGPGTYNIAIESLGSKAIQLGVDANYT